MRDILAARRPRRAARSSPGPTCCWPSTTTARSRPIVADPDKAAMRADARARCSPRLAARYPCVVISGRARADVAAPARRHRAAAGRRQPRPRALAGRRAALTRRCGAGAAARSAGSPGSRASTIEDKALSRSRSTTGARARRSSARAAILRGGARRSARVRLIGRQAGGQRRCPRRPRTRAWRSSGSATRLRLRHRDLRGRRRDRRGRVRARPAPGGCSRSASAASRRDFAGRLLRPSSQRRGRHAAAAAC